MSRSYTIVLVFAACAVLSAARGKPAPARAVAVEKIPTALAAFEKAEFGAIDKLFQLAQAEVNKELKLAAAAPAGAAGAPGAPSLGAEGGDRIPATGPAWVVPAAYKGLTGAMKAAILPKFVPQCAGVIEGMVEKMAAYLAQNGASNSTIGHSMATQFQVTCEGAFPVKEQQCDDTSVQLAKLIESGAPLNPPAPGAPAGAPAGAPGAAGSPIDSGPAWCAAFFAMYYE